MRHFTIILVVLNFSNCGFLFYTLFTLFPFETKNGSIFRFWTENVFPNRSNIFCPRMAKGGSLLVFYTSNILVDKKHFM